MKIELDSVKKMLRRRGLEEGGRVQRIIDSEVLRRCEPLTPFLGGALARSGVTGTVIGSGEIVYNSPYGKYQYYGKSKSGKPLNYTKKHEEAGSLWFERMKAANKEQILKIAQEAADE